MQQPTKIEMPFANYGDYNVIPVNTTQPGEGYASYREGFPVETSRLLTETGKAVKRKDFNGIFHAITSFLLYQQSGGMFGYDETVDYDVPSLVWDTDNFFLCKAANGPSSRVVRPYTDNNETCWQPVGGGQALQNIWDAINRKADANHTHDASQITGGGVITAYESGASSWYVKFGNGFLIQGGRSGGGASGSFTFPQPFSTDNFGVMITATAGYSSKRYYHSASPGRTEVSWIDYQDGSMMWIAAGF